MLKMNGEEITEKVWNVKLKGKRPRRKPRSRWEQQIREGVTQNIGRNRGEAASGSQR